MPNAPGALNAGRRLAELGGPASTRTAIPTTPTSSTPTRSRSSWRRMPARMASSNRGRRLPTRPPWPALQVRPRRARSARCPTRWAASPHTYALPQNADARQHHHAALIWLVVEGHQRARCCRSLSTARARTVGGGGGPWKWGTPATDSSAGQRNARGLAIAAHTARSARRVSRGRADLGWERHGRSRRHHHLCPCPAANPTPSDSDNLNQSFPAAATGPRHGLHGRWQLPGRLGSAGQLRPGDAELDSECLRRLW